MSLKKGPKEMSRDLLLLKKEISASRESRRGLELSFQELGIKLNNVIDSTKKRELPLSMNFIKRIQGYINNMLRKEFEGKAIDEKEIKLAELIIEEVVGELKNHSI